MAGSFDVVKKFITIAKPRHPLEKYTTVGLAINSISIPSHWFKIFLLLQSQDNHEFPLTLHSGTALANATGNEPVTEPENGNAT